MGLRLMRRAQDRRLMSAFKMSPETVVTYLLHLEEHYNCHTPYHNNVHAADVTQSAYVLLSVAALQVTQTPPHSSVLSTGGPRIHLRTAVSGRITGLTHRPTH